MNRAKIIGAAVLAVLLIILMVQNQEPVTTHLLFVEVRMAQSILLLVTAALGFGSGTLLTWFLLRRRRRQRASASPATKEADQA